VTFVSRSKDEEKKDEAKKDEAKKDKKKKGGEKKDEEECNISEDITYGAIVRLKAT